MKLLLFWAHFYLTKAMKTKFVYKGTKKRSKQRMKILGLCDTNKVSKFGFNG